MSYAKLKNRIKNNEGFSQNPYIDQTGNLTIGYGHLITKNNKDFLNKKISKKYLSCVFEEDFKKALIDYKKNFTKLRLKKKEKELLVEMIFQMGIKNVLGIKKMLLNLKIKKKNLVVLEMMDSIWYKQTPKRVENLIKHYLDHEH